jgi:aminoglycoside 3'-phosphotransferase-1
MTEPGPAAGVTAGTRPFPDGSVVEGLPAWRVLDPEVLLAGTAEALRAHHARPTAGHPPRGDDELLAEARRRVGAGLVERERFDPPYRRYGPAELLELAERSRPGDEGRTVVVHGDARLSTLVVEAGRIVGWRPSPRTGLGDPYRDLATLAIDLAAQVGPESLGPFFAAYGIDHPDVRRVDFHVLVDQLLR